MAAAPGQDFLPAPEGSLRISRHQESDSGIFAQVNGLAYDLDKRRESGERANRCGHQLVVFPTYVDLVSPPSTKSKNFAGGPGGGKGGKKVDGARWGEGYEVGMPAIAAARWERRNRLDWLGLEEEFGESGGR
jgi:hypothetical protein